MSPPLASDETAAWAGEVEWLPGETIRIEAAAYRGAPVFFRVVMPWMAPASRPAAAASLTYGLTFGILLAGAVAAAGLVAYRNFGTGRADRRGATKLFIWVTVAHTAAWVVMGHHAWAFGREWEQIQKNVGGNLFLAGTTWLLYLSLEPFVRRRSPETLISWSRITAGRPGDPRVGRDILVGLVVGAVFPLVEYAGMWTGTRLRGGAELRPMNIDPEFLTGARGLAGKVLDTVIHALLLVMVVLFVITMLRALLRRDWLAGVVFAVGMGLLFAQTTEDVRIFLPVIAFNMGLVYLLANRFGLVAFAAALYSDSLLRLGPVAADPSSWVGGAEIFVSLVVAAIAVWAFRISLGGRPALGAARRA